MKAKGIQNPVRFDKRLLELREGADYLGITLWSMRNLVWNNEIPAVRWNRRIYVDKRDLDIFVEKKKAPYAI